MVSWRHIFWVAPIFTCIGFIVTGLLASAGPIARKEDEITALQSALREATKKLDTVCDECGLSIELNAKMKDLQAVLEEKKTLAKSNSQLRGMLMRLQAGGRLGK
jgi:hypothetical protein